MCLTLNIEQIEALKELTKSIGNKIHPVKIRKGRELEKLKNEIMKNLIKK